MVVGGERETALHKGERMPKYMLSHKGLHNHYTTVNTCLENKHMLHLPGTKRKKNKKKKRTEA